MDDAQKRARQFNAEARIAELEAEVARLRLALKQNRAENDDRALVRGLKALKEARVKVWDARLDRRLRDRIKATKKAPTKRKPRKADR